MIRAIVADVDGVMVGGTHGVNFPLPHEDVISALREIKKSGIPIILCTAKFHAAIEGIISKAHLDNPHITDGGALIIDPLENEIVGEHLLDKKTVERIVKGGHVSKAYTECYTNQDYYIEKSQVSDFTLKKIKIVQKEPVVVDNLSLAAQEIKVIKINAYCDNDKKAIDRWDLFLKDIENIHFIWTMHPSIPDHRSTTITVKDVSKASAMKELLERLNIELDETLGIGDTLSDWNFMELCGYKVVVGGNKELEELVEKGKKGNYFLAPSVEENGLIQAFKHFKLL